MLTVIFQVTRFLTFPFKNKSKLFLVSCGKEIWSWCNRQCFFFSIVRPFWGFLW